MGTKKWGIKLEGHSFDLDDWANTLKKPFDPWIEQRHIGNDEPDEFVLHWSGFDNLPTSSAVEEKAPLIIDRLNSVMWIERKTHPVHAGPIVEFLPDGSRHFFVTISANIVARAKASAVGVAISPTGTALPPPEPTESTAQKWLSQCDAHELLADALTYFSKLDWFDIYKAIECLEDKFGGEARLKKLAWISSSEIERLKWTANSLYRHRKGGRSPPPTPMTIEEARGALAILIRRAFEQVE